MGAAAAAAPGGVYTSSPPSPNYKSDAPPTREAEQSVSSDGEARYSIPFEVPPGRNGAQPSVVLSYSSRNPLRGGIANGWVLPVPTISVDTSQGRAQGVRYQVGGMRLVPVSEPQTPAGATTYRADGDTAYTRYEKHSDGKEAGYWIARATDGSIAVYGQGNAKDERTDGTPGDGIYGGEGRWFLSSTTDAKGNLVEYQYANVAGLSHNGSAVGVVDVHLAGIQYGKNVNDAASVHHARIDFNRSPAPTCAGSDVPIGAQFTFRSGIRRYEGAYRLDSITSSVLGGTGGGWVKRRELTLGYDKHKTGGQTESCTGRYAPFRQLLSVQLRAWGPSDPIASPSVVLEPTTFTYSGMEYSYPSAPTYTGLSDLTRGRNALNNTKPGGWPTLDRIHMDLNGDGLVEEVNGDLCNSLPKMPWANALPTPGAIGTPNLDQEHKMVWEGCSLAAQVTHRATDRGDFTCGRNTNYYGYRFFDVNGDGKADLVAELDYQKGRYRPTEDLAVSADYPACDSSPPPPCLDGGDNRTACLFGFHLQQVMPFDTSYPFSASGGGGGSGGAGGSSSGFAGSAGTAGGGGDGQCVEGGGCHDPQCMGFIDNTLCCSERNCPVEGTYPALTDPPEAKKVVPEPVDDLAREVYRGNSGGGQPYETNGALPPPSHAHCGHVPDLHCGYYVYRVHLNVSTGSQVQFASAPQIIRSPVPIDPVEMAGDAGDAPMANASSWRAIVDIDGDERPDAIYQRPWLLEDGRDEGPSDYQVWFGSQTGTGAYTGNPDGTGISWHTPATTAGTLALPIDMSNASSIATFGGRPVRAEHESVSLHDINGDGLRDLTRRDVVQGATSIRVFYNTGHGFETTGTVLTSELPALSRRLRWRVKQNPNGTDVQLSAMSARIVDLDGDGLDDVIRLPEPDTSDEFATPLSVPSGTTTGYFNTGDRLIQTSLAPTLGGFRNAFAQVTFEEQDAYRTVSDVTDMNGDGAPDIVMPDDSSACHPNLDDYSITYESCGIDGKEYHAAAQPLRVLTKVDNGVGASVSFDYTSLRDETTVTRDSNHLRTRPMWVVKSMTVAGGGTSATTQYQYQNPVFNFDRQGRFGFRGFDRSIVSSPVNATGRRAKSYTDYRYDLEERGLAYRSLSLEVSPSGTEQLVTVNETRYVETPILGTIRVFQANDSITSTCEAVVTGATETAISTCLSNARVKRIASDWTALGPVASDQSTIPVAYTVTKTRRLPTRGHSTADVRIELATYDLRYTTAKTQVLPLTSRTRDSSGTQYARGAHLYDAVGNEIETRVWIDNTTFAKTTRTFDSKGNVLSVTRPMQQGQATPLKQSMTYDGYSLYPKTTTNELGHKSNETHDLATGVILEAVGVANEFGVSPLLRTKIDGLGRVKLKERGTLQGTTATLRAIVKGAYVDAGALRSATVDTLLDGSGATERWVRTVARFDALGRLVAEEAPGTTGTAIVARTYDATNTIVKVTVPNPAGSGTQMYVLEHDGLGRATRAQSPLEAPVVTTYLGASATIRRTATDTTPSSIKTVVSDSFGRVESVSEGAAAHMTSYAYDIADNLVSILDADGLATDIAYDQRKLRTRITRGSTIFGYAYDLHGNRVAVSHPTVTGDVDPAEDVGVWRYDALDRLKESEPALRDWTDADAKRFGNGTTTNRITRYTYDQVAHGFGIGKLTRVETPALSTNLHYTSEGWLQKEERAFAIAPEGVAFSASATQTIDYGPGGQVTGVQYPDAATSAKFTYDERGRPTKLDLTAGASTALVAELTRNLAGLVTKRATGVNGVEHTFTRDAEGRVTLDDVKGKWGCTGVGCTIATIAGEKLTFTSLGQVETSTDRAKNRKLTYTYDDLDQLVTATTGTAAYQANLTFSPAGRVLAANVNSNLATSEVIDRNVTHDYAPRNESDVADPAAVRALKDVATGNELASLVYDPSGNLTDKQSPDGTLKLTYDGENRLREARNVVTNEFETYFYDQLGERVLTYKSAAGQKSLRHRMGTTEVFHNADGTVATRTVDVGLEGPALARVTDGDLAKLEYLFHGVLGSLLATTNAAGEGTARYGYGPFGEELYTEGANAKDFDRRYNGKPHDELSNLRYYGQRYYDPLTVSWTQADPFYRFVPEAGLAEPRRMGLYGFNLNNPVRYVDPDGLDSGEDFQAELEAQRKRGRPADHIRTRITVESDGKQHVKEEKGGSTDELDMSVRIPNGDGNTGSSKLWIDTIWKVTDQVWINLGSFSFSAEVRTYLFISGFADIDPRLTNAGQKSGTLSGSYKIKATSAEYYGSFLDFRNAHLGSRSQDRGLELTDFGDAMDSKIRNVYAGCAQRVDSTTIDLDVAVGWAGNVKTQNSVSLTIGNDNVGSVSSGGSSISWSGTDNLKKVGLHINLVPTPGDWTQ